MAVFRLANPTASGLAQEFIDRVSGGSGPGIGRIYNGTIPANPQTAITTQTLLGTITFSDPVGSITNGILTLGAVTSGEADATGIASWVRWFDSDLNVICDMDVSDDAGNGIVKFNTVSFVVGGSIEISSGTLNFRGY